MNTRNDIRNMAIIAHVDHGKTTLVDSLLKASSVFRANEKVEERIMDSNDIERERGITILAKNTSIYHNGVKMNIVDTPGHADFGGEVERVLKMVDAVLLVVDATEGCMPQTKFVLKKALNLNLKAIVVINKIDREWQRAEKVLDEVFELFIELGADDDQLDFPVVYTSAKKSYAKYDLKDDSTNMEPLFQTILNEVPAPVENEGEGLQILVSTIDSNEYVGRIAIGKINRGTVRRNQMAVLVDKDKNAKNVKISSLFTFEGLKKEEAQEVNFGDIVAISGIDGINIGDTICDVNHVESLDFVQIDEPTLSMNFIVNDSPFAGREGDYVTSRHLRGRLMRELETNVSLKVEETDSKDTFKVSGRGELHLSILIENMRREGYEFQVSKPVVIYKEKNGKVLEPMELLVIDVPEDYVGNVIQSLGERKAEMVNMTSAINGYSRLEFRIPSRGLIGYRSEFINETRGNGIMNTIFEGYEEYKGEIDDRPRGSLVAFESGLAVTYGLYNAQERGELFIGPSVEVYEGMIVGECSRGEDIEVNVCKKKQLTNMRAAGSDDALRLVTPVQMTLEKCLEFITTDELVEVTPKSIRMRKMILDSSLRKKSMKKAK
ncbi:MAG: translational GTPase TypA [Oscillospiraceae bacterium]|nr:translational GTPase TypA [Oscillospiraceae bacterium]